MPWFLPRSTGCLCFCVAVRPPALTPWKTRTFRVGLPFCRRAGDPGERFARAVTTVWLRARCSMRCLLAKNEQISLDAYHGMTCGAVTGFTRMAGSLSQRRSQAGRPFISWACSVEGPEDGAVHRASRARAGQFSPARSWPVCCPEDLQSEVPCPINNEWLLTQRLFFPAH